MSCNGSYLWLMRVSNFTPDSLLSKFLTETNTDEMKDVDSMFPQPAAVTLSKTQF